MIPLPLVLSLVPKEAWIGLAKGSLKLTGSVIRQTGSGQIAYHLQETKALGQLVGSALGSSPVAPGIGAMDAIDFAMQAGQLVDIELTRRGVSRVDDGIGRLETTLGGVKSSISDLGQMSIANLAVSSIGVGVSLVGFSAMAIKLAAVSEAIERTSAKLEEMDRKIDQVGSKIDRVRQDLVDADFVQIRSLAGLYEEAWDFRDKGKAEQQWLRVSHEARIFQDRFAWRARELLFGSPASYELAEPMLDALALAGGLRVSALYACNEAASVRSVADENAHQIEALTGTIGLPDLVREKISDEIAPGSQDWGVALSAASERLRPVIARVRQREAGAATRSAPLESLNRIGMAPREWIEEARQNNDSPFIAIKASEEL